MLPCRPSPLPVLLSSASRSRALHADRALVRVRSGAYADRDAWAALPPWDRYLVRIHAFAAQHPDAVFAFESAAALLGGPLFGEPRDVHVLSQSRIRSRRFGDVCVHTSGETRRIATVDGIRLTVPAETTADLVRLLPPAFGLAFADAMTSPAQSALVTVDDLAAVVHGRLDPRGRTSASWVLDELDPRSESPGESVSRAVMHWLGFERPELQQPFRFEGHHDRSDFWWPGPRVVGESDGWGKYDAAQTAASISALRNEKRREDRLRRHVGGFARWDVATALRAHPLRDILVRAGVRIVARPNDAMLATLTRTPRTLPSTEKPLSRRETP